MKTMYTAHANAKGGRDGQVKSSDAVLDFKIVSPKELGGPGGAFTNPEQLFAAGYAACFDSALRHVVRLKKIEGYKDSNVTAHISIGQIPSGGFGLAAELEVKVEGLDQSAAQELVHTAHQVCPYSNATRNNMEVKLTVNGVAQ
jgi:lipoyl-dependent peroxiredoxin